MVRQIARTVLSLILAGSLCLTGVNVYRISHNPALRALVDRGTNEIVAASDRDMARHATPERVAERLDALLAEEKHNWLAIDAVADTATELGIAIPPELFARMRLARDAESGVIANAQKCAACAYDPGACELSAILICQAPMVLTPLGDLAGVTLESGHYLGGGDVDEINLTLSLAGLAAVGLLVVSGGSSATVKLGASATKLARRMNLLSPKVTRMLADVARSGVDWTRVRAARSGDDLIGALNPKVFAPLTEVLAETGRIAGKLDVTETLHVLRYIDSADDARRLANASDALGRRMVGRLEILGKSRFLRATLKYSDTAWAVMTGLIGLFYALASMIGSVLSSALMRALRRTARS